MASTQVNSREEGKKCPSQEKLTTKRYDIKAISLPRKMKHREDKTGHVFDERPPPSVLSDETRVSAGAVPRVRRCPCSHVT